MVSSEKDEDIMVKGKEFWIVLKRDLFDKE